MSHIVVVTNDQARLAAVLRVLDSAGYQAAGASTFEEATSAVAAHHPDLVIADERLAEYNGLHVILRARVDRKDVSAIITAPRPSPGLKSDAKSMNVRCVMTPKRAHDWLEHVSSILDAEPHDTLPTPADHAHGMSGPAPVISAQH